MRFIHEQMSIALARELQQHYKEGTVTREVQAGFDSREVDIVVKNGKETIFYEIKTNLTLPIAIRSAIGQLMEYCHWSQEIRADHWIIVTQPFIDTKAAEFYLQHLRRLYKLPVYLQTFDHLTGALTELLPKSAFHNWTENPCFLSSQPGR